MVHDVIVVYVKMSFEGKFKGDSCEKIAGE
jgi:hypothetical protein